MSRARATAVSEAELLQRRLAHAQQLVALFGNPSSVASQTAVAYLDLVDDLLIDIAQEVHREVVTGVTIAGISLAAEEEDGASGDDMMIDAVSQQDHHEDLGSVGAGSLSSAATAAPPSGRGPLDVFGRSHPAKATDVVLCKNCGRQVQAGSFAPHLEKCMGKGRAAARNASRRIQGLL